MRQSTLLSNINTGQSAAKWRGNRVLPMLLRTILTVFVITYASGYSAIAQGLSIINLDDSSFPQISADVIAVDANGNPITNLSSDDFVITENGNPVQAIIDVSCQPPTQPTPISIVFVNDRSGSMITPLPNGDTHLGLIQKGTRAFLQTVDFTPPTAAAITAFNDDAYLISDFRSATQPLINAINSLEADGGTYFDPAFLDPMVGGIELLKTRPTGVKRILVFVTDGSPNIQPNVTDIVNAAIQANVTIYAITIGARMIPALQQIAAQTGGAWYGDVNTTEALEGIYRQLALITRGTLPCHISWQTTTECAPFPRPRTVQAEIPSRNLTGTTTYAIPPLGIVELETSSNFLWFGQTVPPNVNQQTVTITARNSAIAINQIDITAGQPFTVSNWGGPPPPFTLQSGDSRTLTLEFAPPDTATYSADIGFDTDQCPPQPITLNGGTRGNNPISPLRLVEPIGNENYSGCDSVPIRWSGVLPVDSITIEYSGDDGRTWDTITTSATGFIYNWKPPTPGNMYRIRISTPADERNIINTIAGGGDETDDGLPGTEVALLAPWGIDVLGDRVYIAEAGKQRIHALNLTTGILSVVAGTGTPGNGGDGGDARLARLNNPNDISIIGNILYIADLNNHKIRQVNLSTGIISTIAGTGQSGFSGDGGPAIDALLQYPTGIVASGTDLYFTETGNQRVRHIDVTTGIINTIAGGGAFVNSDGAAATLAQLTTPSGITIRGDTLYLTERGVVNRVRMVDLNSGLIWTLAGEGQAGSTGDGGPAIDARLNAPAGITFAGNDLYISESTGGRIRKVDMGTRIISTFAGDGFDDFKGDGGPARSASMYFPAGLAANSSLLIVADRINNRIRAITFAAIDGIDSSRAPFTVATPHVGIGAGIAGKAVDMGELALAKTRDSVILAALCNTGNFPLLIDSVEIVGGDKSDFSILFGSSFQEIQPGDCIPVAISFRPTRIGTRNALAIFHGVCSTPDTLLLTGTGIQPCAVSAIATVDMGSVIVGETSPDSIVTQILCNTGSGTLRGSVHLTPQGGAFTIISGDGDFELGPGECLELTVRFRPDALGQYMATIKYELETRCGGIETQLVGRGVTSQSLVIQPVQLPRLRCPGDMNDTAIVIRNLSIVPISITSAALIANNEGFSLLAPVPTNFSPLVIPAGESRTLGIRFAPAAAGTKSAMLRLESDGPDSPHDVALSGGRDSIRLVADAPSILFTNPQGTPFPLDSIIVLRNTGDIEMTVTGSTLADIDVSFFALPGSQFPRTVQPNDTIHIHIQALKTIEDRLYRATARLVVEPACANSIIDVELLQPGSGPILSVPPVLFAPIICADQTIRDTVIILRNIGGSILRITGYELQNDAEGNFEFGTTLPFSIDPGAEKLLPVRFVPKSPGAKTAQLVLQTNGNPTEIIVPLDAVRETISFTLAPPLISFNNVTLMTNANALATVTNTGTAPISWQLSALTGLFTVISVEPPTAGPGESSIITLQFRSNTDGDFRDTLHISEPDCGLTEALAMHAVVGKPAITRIVLPIDSATAGHTVRLSIMIELPDRNAFTQSGADSFRLTITFRGTILYPSGVTNGTMQESFDVTTKTQTVVIEGTYSGSVNDTLTSLLGLATLGDTDSTPLVGSTNEWLNRPNVSTTLIDGLFSITGTCLDVGLRISATPRINKIHPMPVSGVGVVAFELEEWMETRVALLDHMGNEVAVLCKERFEAGENVLQFQTDGVPSGAYLLVISTPYGQASQPLVIVR